GYANTMECLAAQYIAAFKKEIGSVYVSGIENTEYYNYDVRYIDGKFNIKVRDFDGTPEELLGYDEPN
nr:hypothetical protein [Candidatus Brocadiales bacterium]